MNFLFKCWETFGIFLSVTGVLTAYILFGLPIAGVLHVLKFIGIISQKDITNFIIRFFDPLFNSIFILGIMIGEICSFHKAKQRFWGFMK